MSGTGWNLSTATAPTRTLYAGLRAPSALAWTDAHKAGYALAVARNNLAAAEAAYSAACAALGAANRRPAAMRRHWKGQAFRGINAARKQVRAYRAALVVAMAAPALASDQVAA